MPTKYVMIGIALTVFGLWLVIREIKIFAQGKQDKLGFHIQLLSGGILALILGIAMILQNI
jgi:hypothetical protein